MNSQESQIHRQIFKQPPTDWVASGLPLEIDAYVSQGGAARLTPVPYMRKLTSGFCSDNDVRLLIKA